ncbi:MAG: FtsX-like permease family protein [Paenisporosarcina sp.]
MLKFIWNSWWRNKERFILLLVGVLILSTGLSYLIGITQANNGTVVDELQKRWKASYHLVVRPQGSRSVTEELNLLEPNYLSGMEGGITLEQYEQIKQIENVEIAAPIAMIGSSTNYVDLANPDIKEPGIYRVKTVENINTGAKIITEEFNRYVTVGSWFPPDATDYGVSPGMQPLYYGTEVMIAGIDPKAEAALVGINQAMVTSDNSRYFSEDEPFTSKPFDEYTEEIQIPVIISNQDFVDANITYTIEKMDIPFETNLHETIEDIQKKGKESYLDTLKGTQIEKYTYTTTDVQNMLIEKILNPSYDGIKRLPDSTWVALKPSTVKYNPVTSPFGERWPYTYEVEPFKLPEDSPFYTKNMYRQFNPYSEDSSKWPKLRMNFIGVFDPQNLKVSKDPLTELPMETYFPAKAQWVMDSTNNPVNPPTDMKPTNDAYGFLTKPPLVLTTLDAAARVLGDKPISAIRVNVTGVETMNEESEVLLQDVANEIEEKTGLITDITLGSSPQYALTHLPGLDGEEALGWVQQPWIKLGSSISIFQEAKIGMSGVIASVILVAIVYVFSSNIIMLFARKKEFAVLLSLGWRPSQLSKLLFLESTILGVLVALISWLILGAFLVSGSIDTTLLRVFLIGVSGLAIYWVGSLIPIWLIKRIKPYESMRSGEVSKRTNRIVRAESILGMSMNNLFTQWQRSLLSIIAIAVPTSLFIFFLFVTFRLKGVLYATWLGEFVALEVGMMHYVAMGVALLIAVLTTTEIMWQNVAEQQSQIAVLKATGWQNKGIRLLVLMEGVLSGLLAGILGLGIAMLIIYRMYGELPIGEFVFLFSTILIPVITGVVGAVLPAEKAARILPYQAISGVLQNSKKVEKQFKLAISGAGIGLIVGILSLFIYAIPENNGVGKVVGTSVTEGTKGDLLPVSTKNKESNEEEDEQKEESSNAIFEELKENAFRSFVLGEDIDKEFKFGELVETPSNIVASNEKNQLISIPITLEMKGENGGFTYKPQGFKLIDKTGKEYSIIDMKVTEKGNWKNKFNFTLPGKTSVILTYEVPKAVSHFLLLARVGALPGDYVAEIHIPENAQRKETINPGVSGEYTLDVKLDEDNRFHINAEIDVMNESQDPWKDIGFYFIPNAFNEENKPEFLTDAADFTITSITESGEELQYELTNNQLLLKLNNNLLPGEKKKVKIQYTLELPENGARLSKVKDNFYLAQWYPMLGHYQKGWHIKDFDVKGESYHTSYGDYVVNYELPKDYLVVSSGQDNLIQPTSSGTIEGVNIKDFYLALLNPSEWTSKSAIVNDTNLRMFLPSDKPDFSEEMAKSAVEAYAYLESNLGENPFHELDIIGNNGNMEYPNVIEVSNDSQSFEHTLVHEIAHQWFYYIVSNDPHKDAWLDEGLTEFVTAMFLTEKYNESIGYEFAKNLSQSNSTSDIVNLPLDEFEKAEYVPTVYGKTPILLRDFFNDHGGQEEALQFLSEYFKAYQFKYVDSKTFTNFFNDYFEEENNKFLEGWLELD